MKVKVLESLQETFVGFYEHVRRRPGDVFAIKNEPRRAVLPGEQKLIERDASAKATFDAIKDKDGKVPAAFSFRWMQPVPESTQEKITTAQQAMDARSEQIKQERAGQRAADTADVI